MGGRLWVGVAGCGEVGSFCSFVVVCLLYAHPAVCVWCGCEEGLVGGGALEDGVVGAFFSTSDSVPDGGGKSMGLVVERPGRVPFIGQPEK